MFHSTGRTTYLGCSTRKSRDLNSKLRRNAEQWVNGSRVRSRRGIFKNLGYNPCGCNISKTEPLKLRGCLLVDRHGIRANIGKRRAKIPDCVEVGPQAWDLNNGYALVISEGKLKLKNYSFQPARAVKKNLAFLQGGKRSCKQLKFVAHFITEYGITLRLYRKLALAATLVRAGKPNAAFSLYRSVANRCGQLRSKKAKHAIYVQEPSFSDSSQSSDW